MLLQFIELPVDPFEMKCYKGALVISGCSSNNAPADF